MHKINEKISDEIVFPGGFDWGRREKLIEESFSLLPQTPSSFFKPSYRILIFVFAKIKMRWCGRAGKIAFPLPV